MHSYSAKFFVKMRYIWRLQNDAICKFMMNSSGQKFQPNDIFCRGGSRTSPRRGRQSLGCRLSNILIIFSEKPYEMKEILVRGVVGGGAGCAPPKAATVLSGLHVQLIWWARLLSKHQGINTSILLICGYKNQGKFLYNLRVFILGICLW